MTVKKLTAVCLSFLMMTFLSVSADSHCGTDCPTDCECDCPCDCEGGWTTQAGWLYWHLRKCGLDYAWREEFTDGSAAIPDEIGIGPAKAVDPDFNSGARVGLFKNCDNWTAGIRFTWYQAEESDSFTDSGDNYQASRVLPGTRNDSYVGNGSQSYVESNFDYAQSRYDLELTMIDVEFGKDFEVNCDGDLHAFAGVRVAFLDQDLLTDYGNFASIATEKTEVREANDVEAYGVYIGAEGAWSACGGFGVYGRTSLSTLVGNYERSFKQKNVNAGADYAVAQVNDEFWCHINIIEFALGVEYHVCQNDCFDWLISLGYEFHTWCNLADFINFCGSNAGIEGHPARQKDSIGFDGLFLSAGGSF